MHLPNLIMDLAVILAVAAVVTFVFRRIRQPVVLGYLIAGIIVGPYTPAFFSVEDTENIKIWAELGVIFLMFSLGLEFSFRRLGRVGFSATLAGGLQILTMLTLGFLAARALGWNQTEALFLGCMVSISSTTIIIKALEELKLGSKKFAELVYGILIVEDLAAILMLVALTNIATSSNIDGLALILAAFKLFVVVALWFLVGIFVIPRFVRSVSKYGNDEMLTVMALGLCLGLVAIAAKLQYSVALGAFIMGSILAESREVGRIEKLVQPLKDIFGAVFFVSVGMLLDPNTIITEWHSVLVITLIIVFGKIVSVALGAFISGQNIKTSTYAGFSMAQIGEFSFIIASLGLTYGVIDSKIYPIIVVCSILTTFATPYLIRMSAPVSEKVESGIPHWLHNYFDQYRNWLAASAVGTEQKASLGKGFKRWVLNAVVVISIFTLCSRQLLPTLQGKLPIATGISWLLAFILSGPSIWAMFVAFKSKSKIENKFYLGEWLQFLGVIFTIILIGGVSTEFYSFVWSLGISMIFCILFIFVFRRQMSFVYKKIEREFKSNIYNESTNQTSAEPLLDRFAPWDARLHDFEVPQRSVMVGRTLKEIFMGQNYDINIVVIIRADSHIIAPHSEEVIYPGDKLLCFGNESDLDRFSDWVASEKEVISSSHDDYGLRQFVITQNSHLVQKLIKDSRIREDFNCTVVGVERGNSRITHQLPNLALLANDLIWIVGAESDLSRLRDHIQ